jgi:hypothetical protein
MKTRKIIKIRLKIIKRARKAQRLQNIKCCLTLILMFTVLGFWGIMTATPLN